ncbi:exocyst complex component secretory 5 [Rhodnius prolixus]|uniref:exocyst complex component secretory 5 n=1 Tax=Rhodnius prolixus TaxID=13249 RepID=UPI003D18BE80
MAPSPVVTGVSPKEGPPGTRVTIRGEHLGNKPQELVGVEICGCDCLLSTEWKSPNKLVARSGPGKGRGEIIVTTVSGGRGTCTVEFRGYHEKIGPLKESAVWVDETTPLTAGWTSSSVASFHIEDPLGLSVESNDTKKLPEDDLQELFPGCNGDLSSEQFSPGWFLLQNHLNTSFDDLRVGLAYLKRKVDSHKEGQLSFLKGNVGSVMEQLETLEALQIAFQKDVESFGLDRTGKIVEAIQESRNEGKLLFDGVLKGREKADRTRNALGVLQRFKFLFTLPSAIDRAMEKGDYDAIISDYSRANNLFGKTDVTLFKKVLAEVKLKVSDIREVLKTKLHGMPNSLDNQKRLIRNLVQLEYEGDPGWEAINVHVKFINGQLNECYKFHMANIEKANVSDSKSSKSSSKRDKDKCDKQMQINERVDCIEDLSDIILVLLPELWSLGQSYFSGELYIKPDQTKQAEFKNATTGCISEMCRLIRGCLAGSRNPLSGWFPHCLRHLRQLSSQLAQIPHDPLRALIHYFRMESVKSVLMTTADQIKDLLHKEDWSVIHDSKYGLITHLPISFENLVSSSVNVLKESALLKDSKESELFDNEPLQKEVGHLVQVVFSNYAQCIDSLSINREEEQSIAVSEMSTPTFRQAQSSLSWEERLLCSICNIRYSVEVVLPHLCTDATAAGLPPLDWVLKSTTQEMSSLRSKLEFSYVETKSDPLVGTIEPSMYIGHFEWDTDVIPTAVRPYANEIITNVIAVHAQMERCCDWLKDSVLRQIVEMVSEEVSRLMMCVPKMSMPGAVQARLDILAVEDALSNFITPHAEKFFNEALDAVPPLTPSTAKLVDDLLSDYKSRMNMQLQTFNTEKKS